MRIATPSVLVLTLFAGSAISSPTLLSHADTLHPRLSHSGSIGGVYTIDLSGLSSWDTQGDESNDILEIFFGANIPVSGIGWDVNIQTVGTSWLSEATLNIEDELIIAPGVGDDMPGTMSYSSGGIIDLYSKGLDFYLGDDGIFRIEIFESYDDVNDSIDALFGQGSKLYIQSVLTPPTPGTTALLGIASLAAVRRRRADLIC